MVLVASKTIKTHSSLGRWQGSVSLALSYGSISLVQQRCGNGDGDGKNQERRKYHGLIPLWQFGMWQCCRIFLLLDGAVKKKSIMAPSRSFVFLCAWFLPFPLLRCFRTANVLLPHHLYGTTPLLRYDLPMYVRLAFPAVCKTCKLCLFFFSLMKDCASICWGF